MPAGRHAAALGDGRLALQLVGCADRTRADEGLDLYSPERRIRAALMADMRAVLSAAEISALFAAGVLWDADQGFAAGGLG